MTAAAQTAVTSLRGSRSFMGIVPLLRMRRNPLLFMEDLHRQYGDLVTYRAPGREVFFLFHPVMAQEMLVNRARNCIRDA